MIWKGTRVIMAGARAWLDRLVCVERVGSVCGFEAMGARTESADFGAVALVAGGNRTDASPLWVPRGGRRRLIADRARNE